MKKNPPRISADFFVIALIFPKISLFLSPKIESTMKKSLLLFVLALMAGVTLQAQEYRFNSEPNGFSISSRSNNQLTLRHNLGAVTIENADRAEVQGQVPSSPFPTGRRPR